MKKHALALAALVGLLSAGLAQTTSRITEVHVYRGQALVTRQVDFTAALGSQEIAVSGLPERVVPDSLYAEGDGGLTIRAVRYRATAVNEEPREEVRLLDQQIQANEDETARVQAESGVLEQQGEYLHKLEAFVAPTVQVEITKGTLDAAQMMKISEFLYAQRKELSAAKLALAKQLRQLQEALGVLQRKRAEVSGAGTRTVREAVLVLDSAKAGATSVALNYIVSGVNWFPAYVARLAGDRAKLNLEYHGVVTQMSGEDWPNVALTLSTSQPNMIASAPFLSPLYLALHRAVPTEPQSEQPMFDAAAFNNQKRQLESELRAGGRRPAAPPVDAVLADPRLAGLNGPAGQPGPQGAAGPAGPGFALPQAGNNDNDYLMGANVLAARIQNLEMAAADDVVKTSRKLKSAATEGLAVDYAIPGKVSLQSRADQQMFKIALLSLPTTFYYTSVPLLSDYVYQSAESVNATETPLLPGPYNAYLDGAFAGRGNLPLVARGESMTLGFGTETQLRVARELTDKTTETKGGNKILSFTYRFRLQNFRGQPLKVRLTDRIPQAPNDQVTVSLGTLGQPLSTDPLYVEQERSRGLLRWDVDVPAGAVGAKAVTFTYQLKLEFDKQMQIGELPGTMVDRMRKEMETMQEFKR